MNTSQNHFLQIYNSRKIALEILNQVYSYDVSDYEGFSTNEVDSMIQTNQLDMLLSKTTDDQQIHKTYIQYVIKDMQPDSKLNMISKINQTIEDLYVLTDTLSKEDCLLIICEDEPNDALVAHIDFMFQNSGIFIVVQCLKRLQFNLLNHDLVPKVEIMSEEDVKQMCERYQVKTLQQLPEISRFDPQARAICVRPGQVCKFFRKSPTAVETEYYRLCVA